MASSRSDFQVPLLEQVPPFDTQVEHYNRQSETLARQSEPTQRLMAIEGIGPITATARVASVGNAQGFQPGRPLAAWLGLTQRQYASGGKSRLQTRRSVCAHIARTRSPGVAASGAAPKRHQECMGHAAPAAAHVNVAAVALAAKHARLLWVLLAKGTDSRSAAAAPAVAYRAKVGVG